MYPANSCVTLLLVITIGISPYAFDGVRWYLIFVTLAVGGIIGWAWLQVRKGNAPSYRSVILAALFMVPTGVLFARLFHVADAWSYYLAYPSLIPGSSGLSIYGAVAGGILGLWLASKVAKFSFGKFADMLTPAIIVGQAIGRLGCLFNGCCHGVKTDLPWGITYTNALSGAYTDIPYQPYVIYEIGILFLILGMVLWLKRRLVRPGALFACYLALYSVWRLASGPLRPNNSSLLGLHQAQVVAILILVVTVPIIFKELRKSTRVETATKSLDK